MNDSRGSVSKDSGRTRTARLVGVLLALACVYLVANFVDVWVASRSSSSADASAVIVLGAAQYNGETITGSAGQTRSGRGPV